MRLNPIATVVDSELVSWHVAWVTKKMIDGDENDIDDESGDSHSRQRKSRRSPTHDCHRHCLRLRRSCHSDATSIDNDNDDDDYGCS